MNRAATAPILRPLGSLRFPANHRRSFFAAIFSLVIGACAQAASVGWAWTGGVTESVAVITARIESAAPVYVSIMDSDTVFSSALTAPMKSGALHRFILAGLKPDTEYRYRFVADDGTAVDDEPRSFRTFPKPGTPASFRFAVASCAKGANSPVFDAAAHQGARFFLHTGDFHYYDITENRVEAFRDAYDFHLSSPRLRTLLATTPLFYQWDDHDFGPNDSNRNSPSSEASLRNYRELVPHHPLVGGPSDPVDQAFMIGRVYFIISDLRSQRDPDGRRMMNAAQDAWLRAQLLAARDAGCPLIFWMSSIPWNGTELPVDRWQGYSAHRAEIADFIKANGLAGRVAILSGDAHMTAIDDGSHSDFATDGGAPVRVFQAGPIANRGSYKAGPYSHGARFETAPGQMLNYFGMVDVQDDGKQIRVTWSGRDGSDGIGDKVLQSERDAKGPIQFEFTVR
ncbi:alkaline phosphatase D family protein [Rariglobus hedericola]|uniref:Metallophosphoesterase family protein n=1 Tax=Rariglobus hedericola TaxID=2597822 RepID=A0A556QSF5_9BACT|nr:metallophosphoesterase family protein [Rariglobus hedericola]TSJ79576.1 metallophosphoesterase family protein [Rariglobus hedericola]